ncbi:MAG: hypothetical protein H7144_15420 [Burkholderiales bacterium]|nr:hypothetical protein [Phycisphaerae bacterium]
MFRSALAVLLLMTPSLFAQHVAPVGNGEYRPGVYTELSLHADRPGLISLRGNGVLGIDWPAPGKTSVTVPWMNWRTMPSETGITLNGIPQRLAVWPAITMEPDSETSGLTSAMYLQDAYVPTYGWQPGRPAAARFHIVIAAVGTALVLLAIRLVMAKSRWMIPAVLASGVAIAAVVPMRGEFSRTDSRMTVTIVDAENRQVDQWIYRTAAAEARVVEPIVPGSQTFVIPQSPAHLAQLDPVLHLDASGRPLELSVKIVPGRFAAIARRSGAVLDGGESDTAISPELVRRVYRRDYELDGRTMVLKALKDAQTR